jgi:hypothetical protein
MPKVPPHFSFLPRLVQGCFEKNQKDFKRYLLFKKYVITVVEQSLKEADILVWHLPCVLPYPVRAITWVIRSVIRGIRAIIRGIRAVCWCQVNHSTGLASRKLNRARYKVKGTGGKLQINYLTPLFFPFEPASLDDGRGQAKIFPFFKWKFLLNK